MIKPIVSDSIKYKSRGFIACLMTLALLMGITTPVSAHESVTDGNISALLHTEPGDEPVSNTKITYLLYFEDSTHKLDLSNCDCLVAVVHNGSTISKTKLHARTPTTGEGNVNFATADTYTLQVTGRPRTAGAFQSFLLSYTLDVTPGPAAGKKIPAPVWIGGGVVVAALLVGGFALAFKKDKANEQSKQMTKVE